MREMRIREAERRDLARITEIYNHYVVNTPVTFDVEAYTVERREAWFAQFGVTGRHRLLVAEEKGWWQDMRGRRGFVQRRRTKRR